MEIAISESSSFCFIEFAYYKNTRTSITGSTSLHNLCICSHAPPSALVFQIILPTIIWSLAWYGAATWTLRKIDQKCLENFDTGN
jgi:hypothetical protein